MPTIHEIVAGVQRELEQNGVRAAIVRLNHHSVHRFTALFRFEGATLRNLHLVDREDSAVERCPDMPVLESYCVYVRDAASRFMTENADLDTRVLGHPKQPTIKSYCGLPLTSTDGSLFGTLCHFDFDPIPFAEAEVQVLEEIAPHLVAAIEAGDWKPAVAGAAR
ncbi:MAG TPA: GAF domain-containing protein [Thermoanaerobaculia bacterium]|nr:GAF domain-containing protein [Thermoanaerobaculia bacterium]